MMDKFATKVENETNVFGKITSSVVFCFEAGNAIIPLFHLGNIIETARNLKSKANLERLKVRNFK
jgi:hypothetical protein